MAAQLLSQLQAVVVANLEDKTCFICAQEYRTPQPDNGVIEDAIRLPCGFVIGSVCMRIWLHRHHTCPHCRQELFPKDQVEDPIHQHEYSDEESDRESDESSAEGDGDEVTDMGDYEVTGARWLIPAQLREDFPQPGRTYLLPQDVSQILSEWRDEMRSMFTILRERGDNDLEQSWRAWRAEWRTASKIFDEAILSAAQVAIEEAWYMRPSEFTLGWGNSAFDESENLAIMASALQTLPFREYRLYLKLRPTSMSANHPDLSGPPQYVLTAEQQNLI